MFSLVKVAYLTKKKEKFNDFFKIANSNHFTIKLCRFCLLRKRSGNYKAKYLSTVNWESKPGHYSGVCSSHTVHRRSDLLNTSYLFHPNPLLQLFINLHI